MSFGGCVVIRASIHSNLLDGTEAITREIIVINKRAGDRIMTPLSLEEI